MNIFLWKWTNSVLFFLPPPPRTRDQCVLHLVPGGIIWCLLKPIMVIKDIICAVHCQEPQVVRRKKQGRNINHQIFSTICARARGFLLPTLFRRHPAGQNRPQNDHKALVVSNEAPYALLFCSIEDFSFDYELSVSLQSDFWMSELVSLRHSESASFTHRWEKTLDSSKKSDESAVKSTNKLFWSPRRSWWWKSTGIERFFSK